MDNKFSPEVEAKLQYYVYALVDPRTDQIFYVGKGVGNRVFQHIAEAENKDVCSASEKLDQIRAIHATLDADGKPLEVKHFIIRYGLTEEVAFEIESTLIDFLTYPLFQTHNICELTNIQKGVGQDDRGIASTEQIIRECGAEDVDLQQEADAMGLNFIAININGTYSRDATHEQIYEATRKSWFVDVNHANKADYALAVYRGIIVDVFYCRGRWEIDLAQNTYDDPGKKRHFFSQPSQLPPKTYDELLSLRKELIGKHIVVAKGSQNPIKYYEHN